MQNKLIALIPVAVVATAVIFFIIPSVFPPTGCGMAELCPPPMPSTIPLLMFLDFWDALAFGVGLALLIYGAINYSKWPKSLRAPLLLLFFLAMWFSLLTWVHDGWHKIAGMNLNQVVAIEYVFHVPWLVFSVLLMLATVQIAKAYSNK